MLPSTIKTAPIEVVKTKPANAAVRQRKCFIDRNLLPPGNGSDPGAHLNEIPAKAQPPSHGVFCCSRAVSVRKTSLKFSPNAFGLPPPRATGHEQVTRL